MKSIKFLFLLALLTGTGKHKGGCMKLVLLVLVLMANSFSATWYVRSTGGDNANAGKSFAEALATTQAVWDSVTAGDSIFLCGGPFTLTATDTVDMLGGSRSSPATTTPIYVLGADADGALRGAASRTKITTESTLARGLVEILPAADFFVVRDIEFDGGGVNKAEYCVYVSAEGAVGWIWDNCAFHNADNHGFYGTVHLSSGEQVFLFTRCEFYNNGKGGTGGGLIPIAATRGKWSLYHCSIHDNPGDGVQIGSFIATDFIGNLVYDNGDDGLVVGTATSSGHRIIGNVFFGNTSDGIELAQNVPEVTCENNIFRSNGGFGINTSTSDVNVLRRYQFNCAHNNTSGAIDVNGGTLPNRGNVTSDPKFTSETDGSEDFSLQADSPCKNVGVQNVDF